MVFGDDTSKRPDISTGNIRSAHHTLSVLRNIERAIYPQPSFRPIDFQYRLQQVIADFDIVSL